MFQNMANMTFLVLPTRISEPAKWSPHSFGASCWNLAKLFPIDRQKDSKPWQIFSPFNWQKVLEIQQKWSSHSWFFARFAASGFLKWEVSHIFSSALWKFSRGCVIWFEGGALFWFSLSLNCNLRRLMGWLFGSKANKTSCVALTFLAATLLDTMWSRSPNVGIYVTVIKSLNARYLGWPVSAVCWWYNQNIIAEFYIPWPMQKVGFGILAKSAYDGKWQYHLKFPLGKRQIARTI